nr:PaaX family transcriptional regulator [Leucobacter sp. cx-169]
MHGEVSLALIYDTANQVGIDDQPVRLALRRLIAAGDIEQYGRGRAGRISLTDSGNHRLSSDRIAVLLAFAQDAGQAPWDGSWRILGMSAPEAERAVRDAFRREVLSLGAASFSTGLYVTPHELTSLLSPSISPYLVTATAEAITMRGVTDPHEIVEALWPAAPVTDAYASLAQAIDDDDSDAAPLVRQLRLADALETALRGDPLIPSELRSGQWKPADIRRRWVDSWGEAGSHESTGLIYAGWLPE